MTAERPATLCGPVSIPYPDTLIEFAIAGAIVWVILGALFGRSGGSDGAETSELWSTVDAMQYEGRQQQSAGQDQRHRLRRVETENSVLRDRVADLERRLDDSR